jgi:hypothetical protein
MYVCMYVHQHHTLDRQLDLAQDLHICNGTHTLNSLRLNPIKTIPTNRGVRIFHIK